MMEYSGSRTAQRMSLAPGFCNHVGLLLLVAFSICVPGALGSGHSHLRSRKLLAVAFSPPDQGVVHPPPSMTTPPPSLTTPPPPSLEVDVAPPPPPPTSGPPPSPPGPPEIIPVVDPPSPSSSPSAPIPRPPPPPQLSPPSTAPAPGRTWNESEKAGVVIAAIAAVLQVAVAAFLLFKRRQMLGAVDHEYFDDDYDHSDANYRRPHHSA